MKDLFKNFIANKKIGYYLVILDVVLALFLGIFFFATYKNFPAGYGGQGMSSDAYSSVPEVIGLFMFLGLVIDIVALILPEYVLIHLAAIIAYCVSLIKQVYCIPNLVADEINQVHYQGGSFPLCLSWLIITFIILGAGIAVFFIGMLKDDEAEAKMKEKPAGKKFIKIIAGSAAIVAAFAVVMTSYGVTAEAIKKGEAEKAAEAARKKQEEEEAKQRAIEKEKARVEALKEPFKALVVDYDFDPVQCKFTEESNPYHNNTGAIVNTVGNYSPTQVRSGRQRVYTFEGSTAEGWQGDYSQKYVYITLWDDGLYNGYVNSESNDKVQGYWYNVDERGEECLMLISHNGNNNMVCQKLEGEGSYYEWIVDARASYNGGRLIKGNGTKYYPLIGMYIDTGVEGNPKFKVGSEFSTEAWTCMQVRNNLAVGSVFDFANVVTWQFKAKDASTWSNNAPDMNTVGTYVAKARWKVNSLAEHAIQSGGDYYYEAETEFDVVEELPATDGEEQAA